MFWEKIDFEKCNRNSEMSQPVLPLDKIKMLLKKHPNESNAYLLSTDIV